MMDMIAALDRKLAELDEQSLTRHRRKEEWK